MVKDDSASSLFFFLRTENEEGVKQWNPPWARPQEPNSFCSSSSSPSLSCLASASAATLFTSATFAQTQFLFSVPTAPTSPTSKPFSLLSLPTPPSTPITPTPTPPSARIATPFTASSTAQAMSPSMCAAIVSTSLLWTFPGAAATGKSVIFGTTSVCCATPTFPSSPPSPSPLHSCCITLITSLTQRFSKLLGDTMDEAATEASPKLERFAIKEANFTNSQTLYCMVQCSPDLSGKDCNSCLVGIIAELSSSLYGLQGGRILNPSCNIRFEMYRFFPVTAPALSPTHNLLPPPPPGNGTTTASPPSNRTTIPENEGNFSKKIVAIVVPIVVAGVILFSVLLYCLLIRKKKQDPSKENGGNTIEAESLQFDFSTVLTATDNFADVNKIGEGGFGEVFKGKFPNGQEIAVKRLSRYSRQGAEEFKNEVLLVAKLQHRNLVRLLGFCLEGEEKILIYEFVPNKSLDYALFNPENCVQLDWQSRYKIISGIARGLLYLHEDSRLRIIHRDLKASNILLDWEMNPQISDFGTARIFGVDQTQARTNRIIGTYGYMPPEYVIHGQFSAKSDVFSYGVIVLEIVSGKKNGSLYETDSAESLMSHAWRHWTAGTAFELVDPIMRENCSRSEIMRCIHIGLLCVQEDVADRPTMASVVLMLNSFSVTLMSPSQPAFFVRSRMDSDQSKSRSIPLSANEASISELEAR